MTSLSFIETRESKGKVRLECLEAWGGNERVNRAVELPGLAGWIYSDPIGKAGGNLFLDRLERLRRERFHVANVVRGETNVCEADPTRHYETASHRRRCCRGAGRLRVVYVQFARHDKSGEFGSARGTRRH
jgi:hypothetical protein